MIGFIRGLPKAELHVHVEGTLEPELMFALAARNDVALPYASVDEVRAAYDFTDLQSFLDVYYAGAAVLRTAEDFRDLAWAYLQRARDDGVRHAEIFFDPQTHTDRGVAFETVLEGLTAAQARARDELEVTSHLIPCILRHLPAAQGMAALDEILRHKERFVALGLDSSEVGHPPEDFAEVFARARAAGLLAVAHAGEEGPPEYIRQALDVLQVVRIDHGVRCLEDDALCERLLEERIPLTVCPLSNVKLRVFDRIEDHNLGVLLERGLRVTVNSDDPAYFGGYVARNYEAVAEGLGLDREALVRLARNSFEASILTAQEKAGHLAALDRYLAEADG